MESKARDPDITVTLELFNSRDIELKFYLEPWGENYQMPPRTTLMIEAHGPAGGRLEMDYADDSITLYGWAGSVVTLFREGTELGPGLIGRPPVPIADEEPE